MDYLEIINEIIDYIEREIHRILGPDEIAHEFGISKFYLMRIFKVVTTFTLKEYIDRRRLTVILEELMNSEGTILEIALAYGYRCHETFTRQFKRWWGCTPSTARKDKRQLAVQPKLVIVERDMQLINKVLLPKHVIIEADESCLYGKSILFHPDDQQSMANIKNQMERFYQQKKDFQEGEDFYLCISGFGDSGNCEAFIGYEGKTTRVDSDAYKLTSKKYMVFTYKVDLARIFETVLTDMCYASLQRGVSLDQQHFQFYLRFSQDYFKSKQYQVYLPLR